jgi:hypothetical protein
LLIATCLLILHVAQLEVKHLVRDWVAAMVNGFTLQIGEHAAATAATSSRM